MNSKTKRHGMRCGRVPSTEASVPVGLGWVTFPVHRCVHQPGSHLNPVIWGFMEVSKRMANCELYLQPLSLLWKMGAGAERPKPPVRAQSSWGPAPSQEPPHQNRGHSQCFHHPGIHRDVSALCQGLGQRHMSERETLPLPHSCHLRNYKTFRSSVPGTGADTKIHIFYCLTESHSFYF